MRRRGYTRRPVSYGRRGYSGRKTRQGYGFYGPRDLIIAMVDDPVKGIVYTVLSVIFVAMLAIGGLCIWPYLVDCLLETEDFFSQPTGKLMLSGAIAGGISLLQSIYLCWFFEWDDANDFSFIKIWMIVYAAAWIIGFILILVFGANILGISNPNAWTNILGFIFNGVLAALMAVVPSLLSALIGYGMNGLWYLTHRNRE